MLWPLFWEQIDLLSTGCAVDAGFRRKANWAFSVEATTLSSGAALAHPGLQRGSKFGEPAKLVNPLECRRRTFEPQNLPERDEPAAPLVCRSLLA
jgi:hypothetical protein